MKSNIILNKIKGWFRLPSYPLYIFTANGHFRNEQIEQRYDSVFDDIIYIAEKLRRIGIKSKNGEYGSSSSFAYRNYVKLSSELREIYDEYGKYRSKFRSSLFFTNHRIEKHKIKSRHLMAEKEHLQHEIRNLERDLEKEQKPVGQKFIPVLDPFGEENWDN